MSILLVLFRHDLHDLRIVKTLRTLCFSIMRKIRCGTMPVFTVKEGILRRSDITLCL